MEIRYGRYWNRSLNKCAFPRWWRGEDEQQAGVLLCHGWIYKAGMQGKLRVESGSQDPTIKRGPSLLSNYLILIFLAFLVFPSPSPPSPLPDVASFLFRFFETRDFLIPKKRGRSMISNILSTAFLSPSRSDFYWQGVSFWLVATEWIFFHLFERCVFVRVEFYSCTFIIDWLFTCTFCLKYPNKKLFF